MKKRNRDYWRARFDQIEQVANNQSREYMESLERKYAIAAREIDGKINAWYQRIANNNEVTITEAKKMLNASELKEFKWSVEEYIKYGQENDLTKAWTKELENASAKFHINRLEALKVDVRQQIEVLTGGLVDDVDNLVRNVYSDSFYRSCFEIQKGTGIGYDVARLDDKKVSKILSKPWSVDGENFSKKLWKNKAKLINTLDQEMSRMVLTGESPKKSIIRIKKAMETSKFAAGRLVMTEQAYFTSLAQKDGFKELDVEEYEVVETLDNITCPQCQEMDGKHFPIDDMQLGVNAPPFHPLCRGTNCPYFNDEFTDGKRASRDAEGKTVYEVPEKMTYPEWKDTFVNGGDKSDLQELEDLNSLAKKAKRKYDDLTRNDPPISLMDLTEKSADEFYEALDNISPQFKELIQKNSKKIKFAKTNAQGGSRATKNGIFINFADDIKNEKGPWTSTFHEIGHAIDRIHGRISHSSAFGNALRSDFEAFTNAYTSMYNITVDEAYETISMNLNDTALQPSHILSDLIGGLTDNRCTGRTSHKIEYWSKEYALEHEAFAHFFGASALGYEDKLEAIRDVFPNAYKEFLKIVGDI